MKQRAAFCLLAAAVALLVTWKIPINSFDVGEKARNLLDSNYIDWIKAQFTAGPVSAKQNCRLPKVCPPDHFALRLISGAANVVGSQICFKGKICKVQFSFFSGDSGVVAKFGSLNMQKKKGKPREEEEEEEVLAYLKEVKPGMIVLLASFGDVAPKLTEEVRELLAGMGSTLINSVKARDNWVFAGRAGSADRSPYEKTAVNDEKTNAYEGWPGQVEMAGCFPRIQTQQDINLKRRRKLFIMMEDFSK